MYCHECGGQTFLHVPGGHGEAYPDLDTGVVCFECCPKCTEDSYCTEPSYDEPR